MESPPILDLGRMRYADAYRVQTEHLDAVLAARDAGRAEAGRILMVEHDAVITVSRRQGAKDHLLAGPELLQKMGVEVADTDRGGDITYHGPGQLVVYPVLDLNRLNLGLHAYMRLLEEAVIEACAVWGVRSGRDPSATGVWTISTPEPRKIAAMGVRVRRWVSMHGLALNVDPNMEHFRLIVPCGLAGRPVTSLTEELGGACPTMAEVKGVLGGALLRAIGRAADAADRSRSATLGGKA